MSQRSFSENITRAQKDISFAEHILRVIIPMSNDQKLLLRSLEKTYSACVNLISFILKYEHLRKNIILSKNKRDNEEIFFKKCAPMYKLGERDKIFIREILYLGRKHKDSGFEFLKKNKVFIMDDDLKTVELNYDKMKIYIYVVKGLLNRVLK